MTTSPRACLLVSLSLLLASCCGSQRASRSQERLEREFEAAEAAADRAKRGDEHIRVLLARKRVQGLSWEELNLDQATTYLTAVSGVKVWISPRVRAQHFDDIVLSAQLDDVSVETILDVVLTQPFELHWEVRDGVVRILTAEELGHGVRVRYYDVKDLVTRRAPDRPDDASRASAAALASRLKAEVHPGRWKDERFAAEARHGILVVRATPAVHAAIEAWLAKRRAELVNVFTGRP